MIKGDIEHQHKMFSAQKMYIIQHQENAFLAIVYVSPQKPDKHGAS